MIDSGVRAPAWADHLGAVTPAECYVNPDEWGDQDEIICVFSYAGEEPHALVSRRRLQHRGHDQGRLGHLARGQAARALPRRRPQGKPADAFKQIDPPHARKMLRAALDATDAAEDPPVSESFASYHAFIRARIRALPPTAGRGLRTRRPWSKERRALIAAEFLASDEAEDLSDRQAASRCRRPHHRLRVRPGQRPAAADEPGQGAELHAQLAAAAGDALRGRPGRDAARPRRLGPLGRAQARPDRGGHRADAGHRSSTR